MNNEQYPRDMVGYGANPPQAKWPQGARLAVQFVINYEEGAENNILHGDNASEAFLSEIVGAQPWLGQRHISMESLLPAPSTVPETGSPLGLGQGKRGVCVYVQRSCTSFF